MIHDDVTIDRLIAFRRRALLAAIGGVIALVLGWVIGRPHFYASYLFSYLLWLGISLGAMAIAMLHHLTGGAWGIFVRRFAEAAAMVLPVMIVLFIPIAIGEADLYPWARPAEVARDALLQHKRPYLNLPFFLVRAAVYALIWLAMAWWMWRASLRHDRVPSESIARRLHNLSAGGLLVYVLTMSFATVDWVMSREPHYYSTVMGLIVVCGQALSAMCFLIVVLALMAKWPPFESILRAEHLNDLGNLLLTLVILWAYMSFAQLLVNWMGNTQEDVPWYASRLSNGFLWLGLALVILHFGVPLLVLLMRDAKRQTGIMLGLCAGLLVMRGMDLFWMIIPSNGEAMPLLRRSISWMDFVFPLAIGAIWTAAFVSLLIGRPVMVEGETVPIGEPRHA